MVSLGHELQPSGFGIRPLTEKLFRAASAVEELLEQKTCDMAFIESLLGVLTWLQLVARPAFAIWRCVYCFINEHRGKGVMTVPDDVLEEFQSWLFLCPLYVMEMKAPWNTTVYMMDSSVEGAGLVATEASLEEIEDEARYSETLGWSAVLEELEKDADDDSYDIPREPHQKSFRILHLFAGPERERAT